MPEKKRASRRKTLKIRFWLSFWVIRYKNSYFSNLNFNLNQMKNLIKIVTFAFIMVLGVNSATAQGLTQDGARPEVVAKKKTSELSQALNLNGDQQRAVFRALVSKEVGYKKQVNGKDLNNASVKAKKQKIDVSFMVSMKKNLTAEQYKQWRSLKKE